MNEQKPSENQLLSKEEREEFDSMRDLTPLEHIMLGSSFRLENGTHFSFQTLAANSGIAADRDFLLRPLGLIQGATTIKEVNERREKQGFLSGWFAFLIAPRQVLLSGYEFDLLLSPLDESGRASNKIELQATKGGKRLKKLGDKDIKILEKIQLAMGEPFFSLSIKAEEAKLAITYLPFEAQKE